MANGREQPTIPTIAIILIIVVLAGLIPVMYGHSQGTRVETLNLQENKSQVVSPPIETMLLNVSNGQINVSLTDTQIPETNYTGMMQLGDNTSVQLNNQTIHVLYEVKVDGHFAVVTYKFPVQYAWTNIQIALISAFGVIILILLIYAIVSIMSEGGDI